MMKDMIRALWKKLDSEQHPSAQRAVA